MLITQGTLNIIWLFYYSKCFLILKPDVNRTGEWGIFREETFQHTWTRYPWSSTSLNVLPIHFKHFLLCFFDFNENAQKIESPNQIQVDLTFQKIAIHCCWNVEEESVFQLLPQGAGGQYVGGSTRWILDTRLGNITDRMVLSKERVSDWNKHRKPLK